MTTRDFAFWLMGSLELIEPEDGLNEKQTQMLKNHLNMVFIHMVKDDGSLKNPEEEKQAIADWMKSFTPGPAEVSINC